jgi:hypothetical protein
VNSAIFGLEQVGQRSPPDRAADAGGAVTDAGDRGLVAPAQRLDAEVDEVGGAGEADDVEEHRRGAEERREPEGRRRDVDDLAGRRADRGEEARARAALEPGREREQHVGPGQQDQHRDRNQIGAEQGCVHSWILPPWRWSRFVLQSR